MAGVRLAIGSRETPATPVETIVERIRVSSGKTVRVTSTDGSKQTGSLVSLTDTAVIVRRDGADVSVPLASVRKVERVSHAIRNGVLIGAATSAWPWIAVAVSRDSCADCEDGPAAAKLMTLVFIGAGAGVGAIVNAARADGNLLYRAPPPRVTFVPVVTARQRSLAATVRW